jgi:hypothetical protein
MHLAPFPCCDITASYLSFTWTCSLSLLCLLPVPCFDCSMSFTLDCYLFFIVTAPCPLLWLIAVLYGALSLSFIVVMIPVFVCICYLVGLCNFPVLCNIGFLSLSASDPFISRPCPNLLSLPVCVTLCGCFRFMLLVLGYSMSTPCSCRCLRSILHSVLFGVYAFFGVYSLFLSVSALCSFWCLRFFFSVYALFLSVSALCSCRCLRSVLDGVCDLFLPDSALVSFRWLQSVLFVVYALFLSVFALLLFCRCLRSVLVGAYEFLMVSAICFCRILR